MRDHPTRILVADWVPSLNKGELAILVGMLKTFEVLGEVEVSVFSIHPQLDRQRYPKNVKVIDLGQNLYLKGSLVERSGLVLLLTGLFAMLQHIFFSMLYVFLGDNVVKIMNKMIWKEYCRSDVIVICHDQVNCIFGPRFLRFSPLYITMLAKTLGKPVTVYANGFSKLEFRRGVTKIGLWKILARYVLGKVDLITLRDCESYLDLKDILRNKGRMYLTADPAILVPPVSYDRVRHIVMEENINRNDGLLIGMTLTRDLLLGMHQDLSDPEEKHKKTIALMAKLVDHLTNHLDATVVFLPHCIEQYKQRDDRDVAREIHNKTANKDKVVVLTKEYSPEELKGLMGVLDLFIGGRVHSVVGALSMGVPSITLTRSTDRRAHGIVGKTMKQEEWVFNIEGLDLTTLLSKITTLLSIRGELSKDLALQTRIVKKKALLNGRLLKAVLNSRMES